ncbi:MAG TPA: 2-amino-4-hydroxy-6-hydroxymethyldihydropteridine diphosphokinase [Ktedonobacterales bacterium]|jgi:2-amino-4-hydroxy-6-hydroxymethyldihydropteridine diphosphokinase|nr:2-amino-4-hydroxy-6-hydroxymethyldihydropteridine diphosphokinase [Ktedonobacterales bacterium]
MDEITSAHPLPSDPDGTLDNAERVVYLGLGSNLGDRDALLRAALDRLARAVRVTRVSSVWDTAPLLVTDQPRFHNAVAEGWTRLDPFALLRAIKRIEEELGRVPGPRYGPRPVDIDILLYDTLMLETPELTIPHPQLAVRAFALAPLAEIAPHAWHPALQRDAQTLVAQAPPADVHRLGPLAP